MTAMLRASGGKHACMIDLPFQLEMGGEPPMGAVRHLIGSWMNDTALSRMGTGVALYSSPRRASAQSGEKVCLTATVGAY